MADFTFAHREEGFDEHIDGSIRGYSNLLDDVVSLSRYFVEDDTNVYDLGCSTGKVTKRLIQENWDHCKRANWIGIEIADGFDANLVKREREILRWEANSYVSFIKEDVRDSNIENASFITSLFTLQFMPPKDREETIKKIYKGLNKGGAFIFSEKTICENAKFQDMLTFNYYDYKRKTFSTEDIMDKERTLRHMMKPNTWNELLSMLYDAGFSDVQPFWRNFMFVGAIAVK